MARHKRELLGSLFPWSFIIVLLMKDTENSIKISFYTFFFILMCFLFLYFKARNMPELSSFYLGVIVAFVGMFFLKAIPFIEGWTRYGSFLQDILELPFPLHHSFLAIIFSPVVALICLMKDRLPSRLEFIAFLLVGLDLFAFISQVPEIMIYRSFFWN